MPQQVFFYDTGLFKTDLFDDSLVIAADLDFYLTKMKDEKVRITNVNWPVVVFNTGATGSNADLLAKEREGIVRKHYSWVERLLFQNRFFRSLFVTNDLNAKKPGIVDRAIRKFTS
jgi:hypothetical protein